MAASDETFAQLWEAQLTALELDVAQAEAMLASGQPAPRAFDPWEPPVGLGPLPQSLAVRAEKLLAQQIDVARRMAQAAVQSRRHHRAAGAAQSGGPTVPVYVDTKA